MCIDSDVKMVEYALKDYPIANQLNNPLISPTIGGGSSESSKKNRNDCLSFLHRYFSDNFRAGSLNSSMFSIFASTVGVGILSLPYAINLSGLYQGTILFLLGMILSLYTSNLLVLVAEKTQILTYESIGRELYGPKVQFLCEISMILTNYGALVAYMVLLRTLIPETLALLGVENSILRDPYI